MKKILPNTKAGWLRMTKIVGIIFILSAVPLIKLLDSINGTYSNAVNFNWVFFSGLGIFVLIFFKYIATPSSKTPTKTS